MTLKDYVSQLCVKFTEETDYFDLIVIQLFMSENDNEMN